MLQESRLYSFIDQKNGFTLHFLEGQKLIHDLALIHANKSGGFHYFRNAILSIQLMISFLKPGEGLGIYVDSEDPYFRLKVEMSDQGQMRTLLLPEDFSEFPETILGRCRVVKTIPNEAHPYTSIVNLENVNFQESVNHILKMSYQLQSEIFLSDESDQSVMISKLPSININKIQTNYNQGLSSFWKAIESKLNTLFAKHSDDYELITKTLESAGFTYLGSREIKFTCHCSRERMVQNLFAVIQTNGFDHVFGEDNNDLEIKCDYCKTLYSISKDEFSS